MYQRLREGLRRTRDRLSRGLGAVSQATGVDWDGFEEALLEADVGVAATKEILKSVRDKPGSEAVAAVRRELLQMLKHCHSKPPAPGSPQVVMVVGVNGVGKTTTAAKLAYRAMTAGRRTVMVAADTFRAAASDQLELWGQRIGVPVVKGTKGRDAASVVHEALQAARASSQDEVVIDTAGRLHTKRPLMDELVKVKRIAGRLVPGAPHQTLLVMDATVGSNGLVQARQFSETLGLDGIVLTKLDGTAKGGIVLAVVRELELPVLYAGVGEGPDDLLSFSPEAFVDALLGSNEEGELLTGG